MADSEIKLSEVDVSPSIVGELLAKCKETRSTDNIPAFIYKSCHSLHSPVVSFLFLSIIQSCVWPDSWKTALITPVFKSGSPYNITNYRPVSILPPLSLIFERNLFNYIYPRVQYKVSNAQHGFRKKRSTTTQMLSYLDEVYHTHDAKIPCAAMYFDFSKAFDSVRHDIIVQKFAVFGFDDFFHRYFDFRRAFEPKKAYQTSLRGYKKFKMFIKTFLHNLCIIRIKIFEKFTKRTKI